MKKLIGIAIVCLMLSGCATMSNGSTQSISINTTNETAGKTSCVASNEEGKWENIRPPERVTIHRDGNPLVLECENANQIGSTIQEPEFQTRFLVMDFILVDACIISCMIDGGNNAFYSYPDVLTVDMSEKKQR